jgi:putative polyketide hydroxylase
MTTQAHVAVVGGGPVGLSAALLLARAGVSATVLERDPEPSTHPKARGIRTRTMELFTRWGLLPLLEDAGLPPEANRFIYCDSLAGEEIARSPDPDGAEGVSPSRPLRVAQDTVHRVLLETVAGLPGVSLRAGEPVVGLTQDDDGVTLETAAGDVRADYAIGADGVGSTVRRLLGIELEGDHALGYGQSIYWHGDLDRWVRDRLCIQFITGHRLGRPANIATVDGRQRWVTMLMQPGGDRRPEPPTPEQAVEVIRGAVGADVDPEIIDIATWRISAQVARTWRAGRVFLAGDAAHSFPPTGGFGMNTGVQDVHNLVWKLASVLRGEADEELLDSYEAERADVARSNASWSVANGTRMRDIGKAIATGDDDALRRLLDDQRGHVDATDQDLGFGYAAGALVHGTATSGSPLLRAHVGHRFPETAMVVDGEKVSSVLGLPDGFVLVTADPAAWTGTGLPVAECAPEVLDRRPAALVRPDGIVAWVAEPGDDVRRVPGVLAALLGRPR